MLDNIKASICDTNPSRWYISFPNSKPLKIKEIERILDQKKYSVLARTSTVLVFREKDTRITLHIKGLMQMDFYEIKNRSEHDVKFLAKSIIEKFNLL